MTPRFLVPLLGMHPALLVVLFMAGGVIVGFVLHYPYDWIADRFNTRDRSEMAGHFLGLAAVLYAVVLGFVVVTAWQVRDHTEEVSMQEQSATLDLFDVVRGFNGDDKRAVRHIEHLLLLYATNMENEWLEMHRGSKLCEYGNFLNEVQPECRPGASGYLSPARLNNSVAVRISRGVVDLRPKDERDQALYAQSLSLLDELLDNRMHRRHHYREPALAGVMWLAFLLGAFVILSMVYLVDQGSRGQRVRAMALCAMIAMMWALAIIFDHPFVVRNPINGAQWCRIREHIALGISPATIGRRGCSVDTEANNGA